MHSAEKIKSLFARSGVKVSGKVDDRIIGDALTALDESEKTKPVPVKPEIWRKIMKSSITKIAAALAIITACSVGWMLWRSTASGIALADVLTRIEQVTGYAYQVSSTLTRQQVTSKFTGTVLVSKEEGIKRTITQADANSVSHKSPGYRHAVGDESYLLWRLNSQIYVSHRAKTYDRFIYDGVNLDFYREQYNDPRATIKRMLNCKHTSLGQAVIAGVTVEGFQITDTAYGRGFFGEADRLGEPQKVDVKLWVDVNTFLPVRLEEDLVPKEGGHIYEVSYDFRWNVVVNPDDFKPNMPEGYRAPVGDIIVRPFDEENAIKGLKISADNDGSYPPNLTRGAPASEETKRRRAASFNNVSDEERTKATNEILSRAAPRIFYESLVKENKDPAYYGTTVTPKDTDKVLLRWKVSDKEYRVIFGDLHAETVSPEKLAELDKVLPK